MTILENFYLKFHKCINSHFEDYCNVVTQLRNISFPLISSQITNGKFNSKCALFKINQLLEFLPTLPCGVIDWNSENVQIINCNANCFQVVYIHNDNEFVNVKLLFVVDYIQMNDNYELDITATRLVLDNVHVTYVNSISRKCINCSFIQFYYKTGFFIPASDSDIYFHSFDDNPAYVTGIMDYTYYYYDYEHRLGGNRYELDRSNVTSVRSVLISDDNAVVCFCHKEYGICHSLNYPAVQEIILNYSSRSVTERFTKYMYFGKPMCLRSLQTNFNNCIRFDEITNQRMLIAPSLKIKKYLNNIFSDILETFLFYPVLPQDIYLHVLLFLYPDCPSHLMRFFFTLVSNSIQIVLHRRNDATIIQQKQVRLNQLHTIEIQNEIARIDHDVSISAGDSQSYRKSGRHNECNIQKMNYRRSSACNRSILINRSNK